MAKCPRVTLIYAARDENEAVVLQKWLPAHRIRKAKAISKHSEGNISDIFSSEFLSC